MKNRYKNDFEFELFFEFIGVVAIVGLIFILLSL